MLRFNTLRAANLERLVAPKPPARRDQQAGPRQAARRDGPGQAYGFADALDNWTVLEWAGKVCGEAGEAANLAKKIRRGDRIPHVEIAREIGDTVIYLDLLAARLGLSLAECVVLAFNDKSDELGSSIRLVPYQDHDA